MKKLDVNTLREAAKQFGVSYQKVHRAAQQMHPPLQKVGNYWVVPYERMEELRSLVKGEEDGS
jgi:hypothetical protein